MTPRFRGPRLRPLLVALAAQVSAASCSRHAEPVLPAGAEAISLLGDTLRPMPLSDATRALYQSRLDSATRATQANPRDPDALIWLGRRTAYLGRYREAIGIFARGVEQFPDDARFLRHRGHRWLSVREFTRARDDLDRAARLVRGKPDEVEPDGLPNARGVPTSTLQTNIWYHLALARYLLGDFPGAASAWDSCLRLSGNPDMEIASRYWLYLALRRAGRSGDAAAVLAPVRADLDIIENRSYHRLLLVFKGALRSDSVMLAEGLDGATTNYGLGAWQLAEGNEAQAQYFFRRAMSGGQWPSFGYLAAEADLARAGATRQ